MNASIKLAMSLETEQELQVRRWWSDKQLSDVETTAIPTVLVM